MFGLFGFIGLILHIILSYFVADKIGRYRVIGFKDSLILCLVFSFIGYLIVLGSAMKNAKGCKWCGNKYNEAIYCGLCGKNDKGEIKSGFINK